VGQPAGQHPYFAGRLPIWISSGTVREDSPAANQRPEGQAERDIVVEYIAWVLGLVQAGLNSLLRWWQSKVLERDGQPWLYFNYIYMIEWSVILVGLSLASVYAPSGWPPVLAAVGLWRLAEITVWYAKLLLDKTHSNVLSGERNLIFLICDIGAFVTVLALLLVAGGGTFPDAWVDALSAFTLNGTPDDYNSSWASVTGVLGAVGGILLLGAGLAVVIGIIQHRIELSSGLYTGPTRIKRPRRDGL